MIKDYLTVIVQRKDAMARINTKKISFFLVTYFITAILFYVIYYMVLPFFDNHLTRAQYQGLIGYEILRRILTDAIILILLNLFFINTISAEGRRSLVKMICAMNIPNPLFCILNTLANNFFFGLFVFLYDIFFITNYMTVNIKTENNSKSIIALKASITVFIAAFIPFKIFFL